MNRHGLQPLGVVVSFSRLLKSFHLLPLRNQFTERIIHYHSVPHGSSSGVCAVSCACGVCGAVSALCRRVECLCPASTACAPLRPNLAACTSRSAPSMRFALHWHNRSALRPTRLPCPTRLTHGAADTAPRFAQSKRTLWRLGKCTPCGDKGARRRNEGRGGDI